MSLLDPRDVFRKVGDQLPPALRGSFIVVGSLAAAYHFRRAIKSGAIRTKDADLVIFHAADVAACRSMAAEFLRRGWTWRRSFGPPLAQPRPLGALPFVRLYPPGSSEYFIEFLGLPSRDQTAAKRVTPVRLAEGWHGIPRFRFMGAVAEGVRKSADGLLYADPSMMALANLLSHPEVGTHRMSELMGGRSILRSAKDLGRVLAIVHLTPGEELDGWAGSWAAALRKRFPRQWRTHARRAGLGLRAILGDRDAFPEALYAAGQGLLSGMEVGEAALRGAGEQLLGRVLETLAVAR